MSPAQLNFGIKTELTPDSQQVTISNASGYDITVTGYRFYAKYGSNPFSTSAGNIVIPDGGSQSIWIKFQVRHNVYHNSELFILNDGHKGALRVDLLGQGRYSKTYYSHTENLIEQVLKMMRLPAKLANLTEIHNFLEHGFFTFKKTKDPEKFIDSIYYRELAIINNAFFSQ